MEMELDFNQVSDERSEFKLFPEGKHVVIVDNIIFKENTSTGIPASVVTFRGVKSEDILDRQYFSFQPKALWRILHLYKGVTGDKLTENFGSEDDAYYKAHIFLKKTLIGKTVGVIVVHTDQDKINPKTNQKYKKAEISEFHYLGKEANAEVTSTPEPEEDDFIVDKNVPF